MVNRTYLAQDENTFVMLARVIATHYSAMALHEKATDITVSIALPSPSSAGVLDTVLDAILRATPGQHLLTRLERGSSYVRYEKESAFGAPAQRRWSKEPLDIAPAPDPGKPATDMGQQVMGIWAHMEPADQRQMLATLMVHTAMDRAQTQALIASLIEHLVLESAKERAK